LADPAAHQRLADLGHQVVPRDEHGPEVLRAFHSRR
jgi:hypothetical protein